MYLKLVLMMRMFILKLALAQGVSSLYQVVDRKVAAETPNLGFDMHIYAPNVTDGPDAHFPVVFFVSGFGGDDWVSEYSDMLSHVVSQGYVVVGFDHQKWQVPNYVGGGKHFHSIMEWASDGGLEEVFKREGLRALPDVADRAVVMGQSAGNHVVGQGLAIGCSIARAFVMLDPVDGYDPYRVVRWQDLIPKGGQVTFDIPGLILDNELDTAAKHWYFPACAPRNVGANHWFNGWNGPVWNVNASKYGHVDCLDDEWIGDGGICVTDGATDKAAYRRHLGKTVALFLDGLLQGKSDLLAKLDDPSQFNITVTVKRDLKGKKIDEIKMGCSNVAAVI